MSSFLGKIKDPDAELDFAFDWSAWLGDGEGIASYTITATGMTVDSDSESGGVVTVWVSGGAAGADATVACRVVTDNVPPRTDERTATIRIRQR